MQQYIQQNISCQQGQFQLYSQEGWLCVEQCPANIYYQNYNICQPCPSTCQTCHTITILEGQERAFIPYCDTCKEGFQLTQHYQCRRKRQPTEGRRHKKKHH